MAADKTIYNEQVIFNAGAVFSAINVKGDAVLAGETIAAGINATELHVQGDALVTGQIQANGGVIASDIVSQGHTNTPSIIVTPEGGLAIKLINQTGSPSVKGTLVRPGGVTRGVELCPIDGPDIIGIVYTPGVADGGSIYVVFSGYADVLFVGDTTIGQFARSCVAADSGKAAGQGFAENRPTSPFATDKHFQEIGHVCETRVGAGLAGVIIHFN